jgi:hypothetical protein
VAANFERFGGLPVSFDDSPTIDLGAIYLIELFCSEAPKLVI